MCKYCEQGEWFNTDHIDSFNEHSAAKIVHHTKETSGEPFPHMFMRGYIDGKFYGEYLREIYYCPWCGRKLSDKENL